MEYDSGGYINPGGLVRVINHGRPEYILATDEWRKFTEETPTSEE